MGVIHKGDREKGMAEWGSYTRVAEKRVWLNGGHTQGWLRKGYG